MLIELVKLTVAGIFFAIGWNLASLFFDILRGRL
jgi:hypothetical protein